MPYFGGYGGGGYSAQPVGNPMYQGGLAGGGGSLQELLAMLRGAQGGGQGPAYGNDGRPRQLTPQNIPYGNDTIAKPIGNSPGGGQPGMFPSAPPFEGGGGLSLGMPNRIGGGQPGMNPQPTMNLGGSPSLGMLTQSLGMSGGPQMDIGQPNMIGGGRPGAAPGGRNGGSWTDMLEMLRGMPGAVTAPANNSWAYGEPGGGMSQNRLGGGQPGMLPRQGGGAWGTRPPETMGLNGGSNFASGRPSLSMSRPQFETSADINPNRVVATNRQKKQAPGGRGDRPRPRGVTAYM